MCNNLNDASKLVNVNHTKKNNRFPPKNNKEFLGKIRFLQTHSYCEATKERRFVIGVDIRDPLVAHICSDLPLTLGTAAQHLI